METKPAVLIVDDDDGFLRSLRRYLTHLDCDVRTAASVGEARQVLERHDFDIALIDFELPDGTGAELSAWALGTGKVRCAYCITGAGRCDNVVTIMRAGVLDVIEKPLDTERVQALVETWRRSAHGGLREWRQRYAPEIIGDSEGLIEVLQMVRAVGPTPSTVLITGESGTGKEEIARALHRCSERQDQSFVAINCAAIPESLIEAELFGHVRGAFTGAERAREGLIASADGGTLFLDEIGDMPLSAQAKLLRVLQSGAVTHVGADRSINVNVRVIAATHQDLEQLVELGRFRADLFYRLSVIPVHLPALRERTDDILPLARHFVSRAAHHTNRAVVGLDSAAEQALMTHLWPGNIRELANSIERAVVLRKEGMLTVGDLRMGKRRPSTPGVAVLRAVPSPEPRVEAPSLPPVAPLPRPATNSSTGLNLRQALDSVEREMIERALSETGGNRTEAAALLGLNRSTLVEKLRKITG